MPSVLVERLKKDVEAKKAEAQEKWTAFEAVKEKYGEEALAGNDDAFQEAHAAHGEYGTVAEEAKRLEEKLFAAYEMEGETPPERKQAKADHETRESKARERIGSFREQFADAFIESDAYKALKESGALETESVGFGTTPLVKAMERKELKTLITGAGATTGDVVIQNDRQPGMVEDFARVPRVMTRLVTVGQTDSDTVEWVAMTSRTNNAAERPEATTTSDSAADAPESGFALAIRSTAVREIKHYIPATRTAMADAGQLRTLIESELLEGLQDRLDLQMLVGNGTAPNLRGILNTAGIQTQAKGADATIVAIHKAITKVVLAGYTNISVLLHPNDWQDVRLVTDANGNFIMGPPNVPGVRQVWGYGVELSQNLTENTGLVGDFARGATLWLRQGAQIAATDSHADWFLRGIIAILATTRAAFGVKAPTAFCTVTGI